MTLQLDPRRLAMLQEMGLRLLPRAAVAPSRSDPETEAAAPAVVEAHPAVPIEARPQRSAPAAAPATAPSTPTPGEGSTAIEALDWQGLEAAVAQWRSRRSIDPRRNTVLGAGPLRADWMVVGDPPDDSEEAGDEPFVGPAGRLLDNMLRAAGLDAKRHVYRTHLLKCRPAGNRNPDPQELAECELFLRRQVALVRPRVILAMGRFTVPTLLQSQDPIGRLRGRVHRYEGVPVVVTYHPTNLLRNLQDKAKAWADLCLALDLMDGEGGGAT